MPQIVNQATLVLGMRWYTKTGIIGRPRWRALRKALVSELAAVMETHLNLLRQQGDPGGPR
ncbi:hypothetical protein GCM10009841_34580 [Microlunatus panaciterrae]